MRDIEDRDPARYFHGREDVLDTFRGQMRHGEATSGGTIILVQGPPGVGKTALLEECSRYARVLRWRVARIQGDGLYKPARMDSYLGSSYVERRVVKGGVGISAVSGSGSQEYAWRSIEDLLKSAATKPRGLLLVLDEVQTIGRAGGKDASPPFDMTLTLQSIHNGNVGAPVVLLAGGLSTSESVFYSLGISRFKGGCVCNLGRLSPEAEGAVIRDWLTKDGKAKGDTEPWIQAIAKEAHGWPQHIIAFTQPAVESLRENGGEMTSAGLKEVLESGCIRKEEYYSARAGGLTNVDIIDIAKATKFFSPEGDITEAVLLHRLSLRHTRKDPHTLFNHLVHKGIIAEQRKGWYAIPIPSLKGSTPFLVGKLTCGRFRGIDLGLRGESKWH